MIDPVWARAIAQHAESLGTLARRIVTGEVRREALASFLRQIGRALLEMADSIYPAS